MKTERVHRFISNDFTVRMAAVNATAVVREMQRLQDTLPLPTVAVGRAMVGALLMASHLKEGQQVGLYVKGDGLLVAVYAEAHFEGQVRGYTPVPHYAPADYSGGLSLKDSIGGGTLTVTRHLPFQRQPHNGTVNLVSGEIGEDIAHYLSQSHQIRSIVSLGVYLDTFGKVQAAGGVLIEVMPGVEDEIVDIIQKNHEAAQKLPISKLLLSGISAQHLVDPYLPGMKFTEIDHDYPLSYACPCNKERVARAMETFGPAELEDMISKKEAAEVTCQMCGRPYVISIEELGEIKNKLRRESLH
ncbi:MAG: Hsp33 family molecular chaperone HslO [Bdellovibrionaceae bacterium]|nr:Hsp33 family molecular chaperone HslO [Pseudobdellovibrionaceae bacterium]